MTTETGERITDSDRLSRLEGAQGHMATKADIAALETGLTEKIVESAIGMIKKIASSETRLIKWMVGIGISVIVVMVNLTIAAITVLYRLLS